MRIGTEKTAGDDRSKMTTKLLANRFRHLFFTPTGTTRATSFTITSSSSPFRCIFFSKFSSSTPSSSGIDCSTAAPPDIADVPEEVVEELFDAVSPAAANSSAVELVFPSLLQPRVVVYDGVCHLCHRGSISFLSLFKTLRLQFHSGSSVSPECAIATPVISFKELKNAHNQIFIFLYT